MNSSSKRKYCLVSIILTFVKVSKIVDLWLLCCRVNSFCYVRFKNNVLVQPLHTTNSSLPFITTLIYHSYTTLPITIHYLYTASGSGSDPLPFLVLEELRPLPQFFNLKGPKAALFDFVTIVGFAKELSSAMLYLHEGAYSINIYIYIYISISIRPINTLNQYILATHPINTPHRHTLSTPTSIVPFLSISNDN